MPTPYPSRFSLGLTGYPLGHSLSPKLHAAALQATGLDGDYQLYPVSPEDPPALAELLGRVRNGQLHGLNVTIPHKQAVVPLLDELSATAQAIGAVNTIYLRDGRLIGDNTDAAGFLADLKKFLATQNTPSAAKSALVLGAGGSARAIVYALASDGWRVTIAARRAKQTGELTGALNRFASGGEIASLPLEAEALRALLDDLTLVVNATPVGMSPHTEASPWPDGLPLPRAHVYDLIYNPRVTELVRQAHAAGLSAQTGLGMLVEQAALAFEIWTGRVPPRDLMFAAVGETRTGKIEL